MSGFDWDMVSCPEFVLGDSETAFNTYVSRPVFAGPAPDRSGTGRIAASLLRQGLSGPEVAAVTELGEDEVARIEHAPPTDAEGCAADEWARSVEERLSAVPEAFLCRLTRELMADPALDAAGASCERSAAEARTVHPNLHLKTRIEAFRGERVRATLAVAPALAAHGFPQAASRVLRSAVRLCGGLADSAPLLSEVGKLAFTLPLGADEPRVDLLRLVALHVRFSELAPHVGELLTSIGSTTEASKVALAAAGVLEASGEEKAAEALQWYAQALEWDSDSDLAKSGLKRLSVALGQEWKAAACLLASAHGPDAEAASRAASAVGALQAAVEKSIGDALAEIDSKTADLEQALDSLKATAASGRSRHQVEMPKTKELGLPANKRVATNLTAMDW